MTLGLPFLGSKILKLGLAEGLDLRGFFDHGLSFK